MSGKKVTYLSQEIENENFASLIGTDLSEGEKPETRKELKPWREKLRRLPLNIVAKPEA